MLPKEVERRDLTEKKARMRALAESRRLAHLENRLLNLQQHQAEVKLDPAEARASTLSQAPRKLRPQSATSQLFIERQQQAPEKIAAIRHEHEQQIESTRQALEARFSASGQRLLRASSSMSSLSSKRRPLSAASGRVASTMETWAPQESDLWGHMTQTHALASPRSCQLGLMRSRAGCCPPHTFLLLSSCHAAPTCWLAPLARAPFDMCSRQGSQPARRIAACLRPCAKRS